MQQSEIDRMRKSIKARLSRCRFNSVPLRCSDATRAPPVQFKQEHKSNLKALGLIEKPKKLGQASFQLKPLPGAAAGAAGGIR